MKMTIKTILIIVLVLSFTVLLAGCVKKVIEKNEFVAKPIPTTAGFADKLNSQMPDDKNYMFSPLSIKMALALAANGADGQTREQIVKAIGAENLDEFNESMASLIKAFGKSDKLKINVSNGVFVNTDNCPFDFSDEYKKVVKKYYDAEAKQVKNSNAVKTINSWVDKNTKGKIKEIISDNDFWAALVNAIYFKGAWEDEFSERATAPDIFTSADGQKTEIDFMNRTGHMSYSKSKDAEIISLPYKNSFSIIDNEGNYDEEYLRDASARMYLIKCKDGENIEELIDKAAFQSTRVKLSVPKFKIEYSAEISEMLSHLGINVPFDKNSADFSSMMKLSEGSRLWIDQVLHKTYISVDEKGTEAAAVTAIMMDGATAARPVEPIVVKYDEPFFFVIEVNGEILFMGRYAYAK